MFSTRMVAENQFWQSSQTSWGRSAESKFWIKCRENHRDKVIFRKQIENEKAISYFCEQNGSRFTAVFFWDRIYLWQYRSISCALAIYGSYITAKMDLLASPDFCHVKEKNYCCKLPPLILCSVLIIYYTSDSHKPFYILCSTLWHIGTGRLCHNYNTLHTSSSEHMESYVCR